MTKHDSEICRVLFGQVGYIIPDHVIKIGGQAFEGCQHLKRLIIPENVTKISSFAVAGCKKLKSITFMRRDSTV